MDLPIACGGNPHQVDFPALIAKYGWHPMAVGFGSAETQERRFAQLLAVLPTDLPFSLLDVGCGYGALVPYLLRYQPDLRLTRYVGLDVFPEMLEATADVVGAALPHAAVELVQVSGTDPLVPFFSGQSGVVDYVYAGGVLGHLPTPAAGYVLFVRAYQLCRVALVVNVLSTRADRTDSPCLYYDPGTMAAWAFRCSRWVRLDHTYLPHDLSVTVFTEQPT